MKLIHTALLLLVAGVDAFTPSTHACKPFNGDIKLVERKIAHPNYFCQYYLAKTRTRSPVKEIDAADLVSTCQCILYDAGVAVFAPPFDKSVIPENIKCNPSHGKKVRKEFSEAPDFCKFYGTIPRGITPIQGMTIVQVEEGCQCVRKLGSTSTSSSTRVTKSSTTTKHTSSSKPTTTTTTKKSTTTGRAPSSSSSSSTSTTTKVTTTARTSTSSSQSTTTTTATTTSAAGTTTTTTDTTSTTTTPAITTSFAPTCHDHAANITVTPASTEYVHNATYSLTASGFGSTATGLFDAQNTTFPTTIGYAAAATSCGMLAVQEFSFCTSHFILTMAPDNWVCTYFLDQYVNMTAAEDVACYYDSVETGSDMLKKRC
ncbi:hypothetical protein K461DRAFT_313277 [Myriangium duriaei CBS 260.36]|uniref:Uncharacterized protein n=1 Tax=Myriangium duriaei CBS 260.36 TaxID=1168546 RepID=A0A9P4J3K3_9PEZI|nr:hypothetical protein K461DRAFT_313277 [Myriangium duriaei CBS 260.36]